MGIEDHQTVNTNTQIKPKKQGLHLTNPNFSDRSGLLALQLCRPRSSATHNTRQLFTRVFSGPGVTQLR